MTNSDTMEYIKKIKKYEFYFSLKKREDYVKKKTLSSLAPKILTKKEDINKIQPYLDKLNETIDTKGINNIALTGSYGSGKSTIIGTFKELNPQYEFLNISLASFNKKKSDNKLTLEEQNLQKEELERLLEVSILQQIFYHVNPNEIPESRFKRIINIPDWKLWCISLGFILWVSSTVLLLKYNYLDKINPNDWNTKDSFDWFALFIFIIAFIGLGLFSKLIIKLFSNSKINKVNIKGELELGDNVNKSVFNEHLEEILYFFERTKFDVVLIEDLDRFDSTDIFTKLREINILLNNSKLINREINFVYAVGDDLFNDKKERVKFFEYIIPVIPFINSSNADEQLRTLIKEAELDEKIFTKEFISDVTTFIDDIDMRLLTNIFHEFIIYRKTLKPEFIKKNDELFAIITYKNIDPKDFTKLNRKEGKLFELINNKRNYTKEFISKIDTEITFKNSQISDIEGHIITDVKELKIIYFQKILTKLPNNALIDKTIIEGDFEKLIKNQSLNYNYHRRNYGNLFDDNYNFEFSEIENEINPDYTYEERVEIIEAKHNNKINILKKELQKLKSKKIIIENWNLKQIFNEIDINQYLNDFSNNGLLRNFILNGYINENYNDYLSLFHEVSITKEDFTFERNIKGGYPTAFNFKLSDKIENLIDKIDLKYFERDIILNFDLVDFLGNNYSKYSDKYEAIILLLSNERENSVKFIDEYIKDETRPLGIFIEKLELTWDNFFSFIFENCSYTQEKLNEYLFLIMRYTEIKRILNNKYPAFYIYQIETNPDFLTLLGVEQDPIFIDKIKEILKGLAIRFKKLSHQDKEVSSLFRYLYENNCYEINENNLLQMFLLFGKDSSEEDFTNSNYSTILKSECKPLIDYINSNINSYVDNVYLKLDKNKFEDEICLIELLNNKDLSSISKIKIIQKVETKVSDLNNINELETKTQLLVNNKVAPDWNNVIDYFRTSENIVNESLVKFLDFEDVCSQLSNSTLKKENEDLEIKLIKCKELSDTSYNYLLDSTYHTWNNIGFENLNVEKVVYLLNKKLNTTKENYNRLREYFPNNHIRLIERNFKKFFDNVDDFETENADVMMVLKSEKISIDNKFAYINQLEQLIIKDVKEISKVVGDIILQKSTKIEFEYNTIVSLVKNATSSENKVKLVNLYIDDLDDVNIVSILKHIFEYDKLFKKGKPTYEKSSFNDTLFGKLKKKNLIKNYYYDKWSDSKFRVTTNY